MQSKARFVQSRQSSSTVSLPSRLDVTELLFEMQQKKSLRERGQRSRRAHFLRNRRRRLRCSRGYKYRRDRQRSTRGYEYRRDRRRGTRGYEYRRDRRRGTRGYEYRRDRRRGTGGGRGGGSGAGVLADSGNGSNSAGRRAVGARDWTSSSEGGASGDCFLHQTGVLLLAIIAAE